MPRRPRSVLTRYLDVPAGSLTRSDLHRVALEFETPAGRAFRVARTHLEQRPDDGLTVVDLADKASVSATTARDVLNLMVARDVLERIDGNFQARDTFRLTPTVRAQIQHAASHSISTPGE